MKKTKYTFVVDLTNCTEAQDVIAEIAVTKIYAGIPITVLEYSAIIGKTFTKMIDHLADAANIASEIVEKIIKENAEKAKNSEKDSSTKKNILKRFWNWITNKK